MSGPTGNGGERRGSSAHRFGDPCARCGFPCCDFLPDAPARRADARAGCALPPWRSSPRPSPARPDVPARPGTLGRHALERHALESHALESQSATSCRPAVAKFANLACKLNRRLLAGRLGNARLSFSFFGLLAVRLVAPFHGGRAGRLLGAVGPACRGQSSSAPTAFGRFDRANQPLSRRGNSYFEVIPALRQSRS
jgi:hypothetical protein